MKKILLTFIIIILFGCSISNENASKTENLTKEGIIKKQINSLQLKVDNKEITKDEAKKELKKFMKEIKKLNDGSTKSILKKFEDIDPKISNALEKRIKELHPEEFEKE